MSPPASLRWDASNLLDVQVDHIARRAGQDRFAGIVGLLSRTGYRLGGHTGDRTTCLDTHHEPAAALRRQRSVTVGHSSGVFSCRKDDSAPPILTAQAPLPPGTPWLQPHSPQTTRPASMPQHHERRRHTGRTTSMRMPRIVPVSRETRLRSFPCAHAVCSGSLVPWSMKTAATNSCRVLPRPPT